MSSLGQVFQSAVPTPPNSARVWRGFKLTTSSTDEFYKKLGSFFIPATVQIQKNLGLAAYLPSILPKDKHPAVPDEIALVFYQYPHAYDEAKLSVGGRAYSDLHGVAFDLQKSLSGFPTRYAGHINLDEKYHLFDSQIDWMFGHSQVFVGVRKADSQAKFFDGINEWLRRVQATNDGPDGAIVAASGEYVVYWEHWASANDAKRSMIGELETVSIAVYQQVFQPYPLPQSLFDPFAGLAVAGGESFSFQFERLPMSRSEVIVQGVEIKQPLQSYDIHRFGPLLGVSDEGSAAHTIADAAYLSAKAKALGSKVDAMCVGMIIDGERMTSAGEVPIGPDEYTQIATAARNRTFCSTNVGVRLNVRLDQQLPEFTLSAARADQESWIESIITRFKPFLETPDGQPRPLTVRILVDVNQDKEFASEIIQQLEEARAQGRLADASTHRLSFLVDFKRELSIDDVSPLKKWFELADKLRVPEVAIDGLLVEAARKRLSVQGILNVTSPELARTLLAAANEFKVRLVYRYDIDEESAARTAWTGLRCARLQGLSAAKYGLIPLTLSQQQYVISKNQGWQPDWTPVPAFYVDTPLVCDSDVFTSDQCFAAAQLWMKTVAELGAKVVLVDAPDRVTPRRLIRASDDPSDVGVLTLSEIDSLTKESQKLGLRILWSGGISPKSAYDLAKLHVAGIFTTSSASRKVAVHGPLVSDPQLDAAVEPTEIGIRRIHALIQAGFLCTALQEHYASEVANIERAASKLIQSDPNKENINQSLNELDTLLIAGWKRHWETI